jgi:hypothetical protein
VYTSRAPSRIPSFPRLGRVAMVAIGAAILLGASQHAQAETIGGAIAGAGITWAAVTWSVNRRIAKMRAGYDAKLAAADPIVRGAKKLARAFVTDSFCADEIRELSKAAFLHEN